MSKMTVIQLLNKIAKGEEPKIKYNNFILKYNKNEKRFIDKDRLNSLYEIDFSELNDEVEILEEEKKIPEKITDILRVDDLIPPVDENMYKIWTQTIKNHNKLNEVLDYLKSKGE